MGHNNLFWQTTFQFFLWYLTPFKYHLFYSNFPSEGWLCWNPSSSYGFTDLKKFHIDRGPLLYHGSQPSQFHPHVFFDVILCLQLENGDNAHCAFYLLFFYYYLMWYFLNFLCDFMVYVYDKNFHVFLRMYTLFYCFWYLIYMNVYLLFY